MYAANRGHTNIVALIENHTKKKIRLAGDSATKFLNIARTMIMIPRKPGDKAVTKKSSGVKRKLNGGVRTNTSTKKPEEILKKGIQDRTCYG